MLAAFTGATAEVKPVNGKNPLVMRALKIRLPMPGDEDEQDWDDEDEQDWDDEDEELPEPMSQDEADNGAFASPVVKPKRRRRMPPMPKTPRPDHDPDAWTPPFEVLPDGTVTGPKVGDADPTRLPEGFDPPRGTFEGVTSIFRGPPAGGNAMPPQ